MQMTHHTPTPTHALAARPERFLAVPDVITETYVLDYFAEAVSVTAAQWQACAKARSHVQASELGFVLMEAQQKHELALARFAASL